MAHTRHSRNLVKLIQSAVLTKSSFTELVGAEIGVWKGHNAERLLQSFPGLTLYCIDPWEAGGDHVSMPTTTPEMFAEAKEEFQQLTKVFQGRCRMMPFTSKDAAEQIKDGSLDFVFIDGDHTYQSAGHDIELWYPKVRPGGLVTGHDYFWKAPSGECVVKRAVDEFAVNNRYITETAPGDIWWFLKRMMPSCS